MMARLQDQKLQHFASFSLFRFQLWVVSDFSFSYGVQRLLFLLFEFHLCFFVQWRCTHPVTWSIWNGKSALYSISQKEIHTFCLLFTFHIFSSLSPRLLFFWFRTALSSSFIVFTISCEYFVYSILCAGAHFSSCLAQLVCWREIIYIDTFFFFVSPFLLTCDFSMTLLNLIYCSFSTYTSL